MKIAVIGGSGLVGRAILEALELEGHERVAVSRSTGVDVLTGDGELEAALAGCDAVIDVLNTSDNEGDGPRRFFTAAAHSLLVAERAVGISHHVVLSIVGVDRIRHNPHYIGKQHQERLARSAPIPATIVRSTQFHDFAGMVASWTRDGDSAYVPPLLIQPIDVGDLAAVLVEVAAGPAHEDGPLEVAGPECHALVDMARRTLAARGEGVRLTTGWREPFGVEMAGDVLLPGPDARTAETTFDDWLERQALAV
ncbi:MAG TPA: NAD(P)H-binding protein [Gaiellales bacterium]|nr:NAD(P)H-binding protein [Gaiellales bacterium]